MKITKINKTLICHRNWFIGKSENESMSEKIPEKHTSVGFMLTGVTFIIK